MIINGELIPLLPVASFLAELGSPPHSLILPCSEMYQYLEKYDKIGKVYRSLGKFNIVKKYHYKNLSGDNLVDVTTKKITGQPLNDMLLEFPNEKVWYRLFGKQQFELVGDNEYYFPEPDEIFISEVAFEEWNDQSIDRGSLMF